MTYKGYLARVDIFVGRVLGVRDVINFHASSVSALHEGFREGLDGYLSDCAERGVSPEKPASGKVLLRIRPQVQAAATGAAQKADKSLNQWAGEVFEPAALV